MRNLEFIGIHHRLHRNRQHTHTLCSRACDNVDPTIYTLRTAHSISTTSPRARSLTQVDGRAQIYYAIIITYRRMRRESAPLPPPIVDDDDPAARLRSGLGNRGSEELWLAGAADAATDDIHITLTRLEWLAHMCAPDMLRAARRKCCWLCT